MWKTAILAILALGLTGCLTNAPQSSQPMAASSGDGAVAATIIAALDGGLVGGTVGSGLSEADKRRALEAEYRALEYTPAGESVAWGTSGGRAAFGEATAAQPYSVGSQNCRQYTLTVNAGGQAKTARGTACRNADGSWTRLT